MEIYICKVFLKKKIIPLIAASFGKVQANWKFSAALGDSECDGDLSIKLKGSHFASGKALDGLGFGHPNFRRST